MSIFLKQRCVPLKYLKLMPEIQEAKCFECTVQISPPPLDFFLHTPLTLF